METTPGQPTLLNAARNFIRKSAGTAVMVIAPLAAVSLAPQAKGQTVFTFGAVSPSTAGSTAFLNTSALSGGAFSIQGATSNNITAVRFGTTGALVTTSGGGPLAMINIGLSEGVMASDINIGTLVPIAYDFTLTKQVGIVGNVSWVVEAMITGDHTVTLGSGMLTASSATFTGAGTYDVQSVATADTDDFRIFLHLSYATAFQDELLVTMNSGSQGFTLNAIPEPSTCAALLGLGAFGLAIVRRSRRVRAA
jgi:hypothetical protein